MKVFKYLLISLFIVSGAQNVQAQTLKAFVAAAENAWLSKDYYSAVMYYNNALEFNESNIDLQYRSAEASRMFNAYTPAETKYQYVLDNDSEGTYPMASFWMADIKQKKGKYLEAKALYELFLSESDNDEYFIQKAEKEIKACTWAIDIVANPDESLNITHLGDGINSPYSEFGGLYKDDQLYFSSLRYEKEDDVYTPKRLISKILKSEDQTTGSMIEDAINQNELHIAHSTFNISGTAMYYTECEYINNNDIRCNIFYAEVNPDGSFGLSKKLSEAINGDGFTSTQPNLVFDQFRQKEILYFVSDKEGGKGKLDIWFAVVENGEIIEEPRNLDEINTFEDDITPFYHSESNILYFSSEGYQSLGGFDVFKAYNSREGFGSAEHLPAPLNSSYHDIYYTLDSLGNQSHFSSNREGSYFLETAQEACCYDIYKIDYEPIELNLDALTYIQKSQKELEGARVSLINKITGELIGEIENLDSNNHVFELDKERDYIIIAEKENFDSDTIELSTKGIFKSEDLVRKLYLKQQIPDPVPLIVYAHDALSLKALNGATVKLVDVETGMLVGKEIYQPNSNEFNWEVIPGKKYRIVAFKDGYDSVQTTFVAEPNEEGLVIKKVYLGKSAIDYLPMLLYFDNDIPDLRSVKTYTSKTYSNTYQPYIVKKDEFKNKYSRPLSGEKKYAAEQNLDSFFETDVRGGYDQMNAFLQQLEVELKEGRKITLKVKGYASPRANSKYNKALSKRRTHSFKNELVKYNGGVFSSYFVSNQLDVEELPFGEEAAPSGISDKISDRRNSIYSVEASRERRIEIVGLDYN